MGGITFKNQVVELAHYVNGNFGTASGLLGLGFSTLNAAQPAAKTFFDNVIPTLQQPLFGVNFKPNTANSYDFGFIDQTKYPGSLSWVSILPIDYKTNPGWWMFTSSTFKFGNGGINTFNGANGPISVPVIADTGTTLMYMPDQMVQAYYSTLPGSRYDQQDGLWVYPCNQNPNVQPISISAGNANTWITFTLDALKFGSINSTTCVLALQSSNAFGINIIGDT